MNPQDQNAPQAQPQQPTQPEVPQHVSAPSVHSTQPVQTQPQAAQAPQQIEERLLEVKFEDDLVLTVSSETVNDMRFLELYEQVATSNFYIPKLLKFLFGEEKYEGIHEYYNKKGQKFTITKMEQVFEKLDHDLNNNPDFLKR